MRNANHPSRKNITNNRVGSKSSAGVGGRLSGVKRGLVDSR